MLRLLHTETRRLDNAEGTRVTRALYQSSALTSKEGALELTRCALTGHRVSSVIFMSIQASGDAVPQGVLTTESRIKTTQMLCDLLQREEGAVQAYVTLKLDGELCTMTVALDEQGTATFALECPNGIDSASFVQAAEQDAIRLMQNNVRGQTAPQPSARWTLPSDWSWKNVLASVWRTFGRKK